MFHCVGCTSGAGCKPNCCTQPRAAPWGKDVALIKVSRSVRATCFMRGNAPCGVKGFNGLRAFGAWHFCVCAKMPNVSIAVYVPPGRCPGLSAAIGLTARPNHLTSVLHNVEFSYKRVQFSCNSWANKTNEKKSCRADYVRGTILSCMDRIGDYSPFSILAFSSARASMSPRLVEAAWFWIAGASSFLGAFLAAALRSARASARAASSKVRL